MSFKKIVFLITMDLGVVINAKEHNSLPPIPYSAPKGIGPTHHL